jgi:NADPH:quinone reductase-like Zn-dependent oxidoreductase
VTPAHELSGVVAALGFGTSGLTVGEEEYGLTDWYRDGAGGALVAVVGGTAVGPPRQDARWVFFVVEANRAGLAEPGRRIDAGQLRPVGQVWPLAEGRQAFQAKQHGGLPGKAVLRVADQRHPAPPA